MSETKIPTASPGRKSTADLVDRTLDLLQCFSTDRPEWGVTELARTLGMTKSRVHRILRTLEERAFLGQNPTNRRYRLSLRMFELGAVAAHGIGRGGLLRPHLERLAIQLGASVSLRFLDGAETVLVDKVENQGPVRIVVVLGSRYPLYFGAAGLAIASALPESALDRLIPTGRLTSYAPGSFTTGVAFRTALPEIRERGYSISDERVQPGVLAIAVPVQGPDGNVVCALVAGFTKATLPPPDIPKVGNALMQAAPELTRLFGQFELVGINVGGDLLRSKRSGSGISHSTSCSL